MPPTLVRQDVLSSAAGTSPSFTLGAVPVTGDVLILGYDYPNTGQSITSIVQTGVTWLFAKRSSAAQDVEAWIGLVGAAASASLTVNLTLDPGGAFTGRLNVAEFAGVSATLLSSAATSATLSSTVVTGSLTPAAGSTRLFYAASRVGPSGASALGSPNNSFIALSTGNAVNQYAYLSVSGASGSYSTTWVGTGTPSWDAIILELPAVPPAILAEAIGVHALGGLH